jgi:hypothetical protein
MAVSGVYAKFHITFDQLPITKPNMSWPACLLNRLYSYIFWQIALDFSGSRRNEKRTRRS